MLILAPKNIVIFGIAAFLVMSMWTLFFMSFDVQGRMINCPFMDDSSSVCNMTFGEHMNDWQRSFTTTPQKNFLLSLMLLLIAIQITGIISAVILLKHLPRPQIHYCFDRYRPEIKLFNTLALAFSKGVIHPKIYA